jgi:hypothetical protein
MVQVDDMHDRKAWVSLEAHDRATDPSVIGYCLPMGEFRRGAGRAASSFCQHVRTYCTAKPVQHTPSGPASVL